MTGRAEKMMRLQHANQLIRIISKHGRRFFYNASADRVASLEIDPRGRIWFVDDYTGSRVYTYRVAGRSRDWRGFSHGGTLRSLVEELCSYVRCGELLSRYRIATPCGQDGAVDVWGYGRAAASSVREEAFSLPMFKRPS